MIRSQRTTLLLGAVLAVGLAACSGNTSDQAEGDNSENTARLVSMAGITVNDTVELGIEHGDFDDHGLDASLIEVENPPAALASMQGGSAEFAYAPLSTALTALSEGIDIRFVAAAEGFPEDGEQAEEFDDTGLVVNPSDGISSADELSGKIVAVPSRNGMMEIVIANSITEAGGDVDSVEWQSLDQQSQLSALAQDRIQGAGLATPFTDQAEDDGMEVLVRPKAEFFQQGAAAVWITTAETAETQPELVANFQDSISQANAWANENIDEIAQKVIEEQDLDIAPADLVAGYFPVKLASSDVERAKEKMATLGFLPEDIDLDGIVIEAD